MNMESTERDEETKKKKRIIIKVNTNFETTNYKEITKTLLYKVPHNR